MAKKIKIVVSDFHLGRGRYLKDGSTNPVEDFIYDEKFAELLGHYTHGGYRNHEGELIINGDFFNLLLPPREGPYDVITERVAVNTVREIIEGHDVVMDALEKFASSSRRQVTFIVGNHDQGLLWGGVQEALKRRVSRKIRIFPRSYAFDGIYVEHGHQNEILHRFDPERIAVVSRYHREPIQNLPWGSYFVLQFLNPLRRYRPYIYVIKPFRIYLRWALLSDFRFFWKMLYQLCVFYGSNRLHKDPQRRKQFKISVDNIKDAWLHNSTERAAQRILREGRYRTVIYGHTHGYLKKQLDGGTYINTGTWNDIINLDVGSLGRYSKLTFAFIDYADGAPRATLRAWRGEYRIEDDVVF